MTLQLTLTAVVFLVLAALGGVTAAGLDDYRLRPKFAIGAWVSLGLSALFFLIAIWI